MYWGWCCSRCRQDLLTTVCHHMVRPAGRLLHHLAEVDGMSLKTVEYVVMDEADRLWEMGFAEQVRRANLLQTHVVEQIR